MRRINGYLTLACDAYDEVVSLLISEEGNFVRRKSESKKLVDLETRSLLTQLVWQVLPFWQVELGHRMITLAQSVECGSPGSPCISSSCSQ